MLPISREYGTEMTKQLRNRSYEIITLKIFNVRAESDAQVSVSSQDELSRISHILKDEEPNPGTYATLEPDRFLLDGSQQLIPDNSKDYVNHGFLSSVLSDDDGRWASPPTIQIVFSKEEYNLAGLTFEFDPVAKEYVAELRVTYYSIDGFTLREDILYPSTSNYFYDDGTFGVGKIKIECLRSVKPYRRARIEKLWLGVVREIKDSLIADSAADNEVDPLSRRLPNESLSFTVWDFAQEYNPDNPNGHWAYVDQMQPVSRKMGYQLDDGTIEWLKPENYVLDGSPERTDWKISFSAHKTLYSLTGTYRKGILPSAPVSLYQLAESVLADAVRERPIKWNLDPILKTIFTLAPLPVLTHKECLQLIAQAGMCSLYTDRDGAITMKNNWYPNTVDPINIDFTSQLGRPTIEMIPPLEDVDVLLYAYTPEAQTKELYKETMQVEGKKTLWIDYQLSSEATATVSSGKLVRSEMYAYGCQLTIEAEGDVTVTITGKPVTQSTTSTPYVVNEYISGNTDRVENPLVTALSHQMGLAKYRKKYLGLRSSFKITYRGNPEIECGDAIYFQTDFGKNLVGVVVENRIDYNGALKGTMIVKRIDSYGASYYGGELYSGEPLGIV